MARSRNIKPGFFTNEDLVELGFATRLLFAGLWTIADREGRLEDRPKKIKIGVFPADDVNVDVMLQELHDSKFIQRYEVAGVRYIQITGWSRHQNPHHTEKASSIPDPNGCITVIEPKKSQESRKDDGGNLADSLLLIPDSLIPGEANASVGRADQLPRCDTQSIVDLYHEVLPEMPTIRLMNDGRRRAISSMWKFVLTSKRSDGQRRAHNADEAMEWLRGYFGRVRDNDFLMGRSAKASGHESWRCDLDFLLSEKGKKHVLERTVTQ